ncbi:MAG: flagellar basal body rod protein FlgB [Zetaproteobacteria bacterium CG06_land_8_20_14_3_00_59_53]|nr:MAG: flagellar basal-body rod protein FlgB [Zetaproteobacteria bacterium CG2_30_59_37]PIO90764.1 MAG: flagellar basal body rod protein FlgB [Zetaproteobacteria bacterium CG23_combo_of_CG06-09_8_20_14_all_59_86]PIQ65336.1 MAG: flagellar basal body rod protein FlgB [Zetaproteobacteria bacterium CG11_big_fil_rev_8_21_14_0_20_59_439]PIU69878.1 MAG: flagellar basal body rod protein FlgB [Zetaproteobacteria bacterium CG06_land_8_20_14_3_00_59_53]PIU97404.1 MAG: flagellar basal body rod protein Flg
MGQPLTGLFDQEFKTLSSALSARERMQSVHAANIANADTPNYHADTRRFADFLAEKQNVTNRSTRLAATQPGHIPIAESTSWQGLLATQRNTAQRMDGNSVDIQKEMAGMAQNQLMHDMTMRLLKKRLDMVATVVREAGR